MKKMLAVAMVGLALTSATFAGGAKDAKISPENPLVLKMSHVFAPNEQLTKSLAIVCDNIKARSKGAIEIQQYPQSQLPVYKDGVEQVAQGAKFISVEDPSYIGDYVGNFNALAGPMLVNSFDEYRWLTKSDLVAGMKKELEEKHRIKVLSLDYIFGFRSMMTNKVITKPEDLKGMKIRTPGSKLYVETLNYMGATAVPMGFSETISAVQQGVVDGLEGTVDAYASNGSAEVAKNMAFTNHLLGVCGVYINADLFNSIPKEYQTIIIEEFNKGADQMVSEVTNNYEATKKKLESTMGIKFNEVDHDAFAARVAPVYENKDIMKGADADILKKIRAEIAKMPKK
ncbi:MAG: C4-dicarboxylate TRAP transporter substrate-binding protein [Treponema sp.]|nr:C4-dicarboxylate TRAP transporter substrate-binding protein [Treponema sp.]